MVRFPAWARLLRVLALLAGVQLAPAYGMTFTGSTSDGITMVHGTGPIQFGDAERLTSEILLAPRGSRLLLRVDSGGGSVVAGESLASVIKRYAVAVAVGNGDVCASACFLLFAASPECAGTPEFLAGCTAAKQRLTAPDIRRKTDAQYWWGWNSL